MAFDAQSSPGPVNSLVGDVPGAESRDPPLELLCLFVGMLRCLGSATCSWSDFVLDSTVCVWGGGGGLSLDVT